ncbi:MAG: restriction endonuclease subunit S [Peptococcales bacterium]|jgi:type I restriction enzyme S subunit
MYVIKYRKPEEMKESGIEWVGKIPREWHLLKGKYLYLCKKIINRGKIKDIISLTLNGVVDRDPENNDGLQPKDFNGYQEFYKDDLVFKLIDLENISTSRVGIVHKDGIMSPAYIRLTKKQDNKIHNKFYYYLYYSFYIKHIFNNIGNSGVRSSMNSSDLLDMMILNLGYYEQKQIANFLDIKTAQFDSIISKKEKLIEKLEEAKKSLISEVVTGKVKIVDGQMVQRKPEEMKNSGVEWLGMIPKEWKVKKLGYLFSFKNGVNADASKYGKGIKFINVKEVIDNETIQFDQIANSVDISRNLIQENLVVKGDIVLNRTSETTEEIGLTSVYLSEERVVFGGFVIRGREIIRNELILEFKKYCFNSSEVRTQIISYASGSIRKNISQGNLKNVYLTYPHKKEQTLIADYLKEKIDNINKIIGKIQTQIQKLKEAKQSLISEAVTGKIDLRDWEIIEEEGGA